MQNKYKVYLVEDDENLNSVLYSYLINEGYEVKSFLKGMEALNHIDDNPHLWILDIMLPDIDGFQIIKDIKNKNENTPVIFISARDADIDKIVGLEMGSDDYLAKPFLPRELIIRIKKLLKRSYKEYNSNIIKINGYNLDLEKRVVTLNNEIIELTSSVNNIIYPYKGIGMLRKLNDLDSSGEFLINVENEMKNQKDISKRYEYKLSDSKLYYVIKKISYDGEEVYLISFMFDTYRNKLSQSLLNKLFIMAAIAVLISLIVSLWFSKYLTEPLKILEDRVGKIAKQDCYEPLNLDRQDEVGSLAKSIEDMRIQLVQRDKEQQNMLQQVSHELKTPIMVIRSYAQAVYDGIYPKGNLKGSIQVIDEEAERLENKVKDLLYLSKLQYIRKKKIAVEEFNIYKLILEIVDKFKVNNSHIQWEIKGKDIFINGDREQWRVVFENILDNATRYAKSTIKLEMKIEENLKLKIYNDGEKINKEEMNNLFKPFNKGNNGKYGLGLSIVKEIVEIHKGEIFVNNKEEGVEFCINISN